MIVEKVNTLRAYLLGRPTSLPLGSETSRCNFNGFVPDSDWIEENGEEAAINRELEVILGSRARGLVLKERRPGIVILVNVLEKLIQDFPNSVSPMLWLTDVTGAAEAAIVAAGLPVCIIFRLYCQ
jgi:hypothetical protein